MKTLEIVPLKDKKLTVVIVEKEYNEPFWVAEPSSSGSKRLLSLFKPSIGFYSFLEKMIKETTPDFATEELGYVPKRSFTRTTFWLKCFGKTMFRSFQLTWMQMQEHMLQQP